ncbi:MAG: hypothetical protein ACLURP_08340 [Ruminococcus sp.]
MAIDLLKFDEECYNLVRLGIEGENWINPDGKQMQTQAIRHGELVTVRLLIHLALHFPGHSRTACMKEIEKTSS